MSGYIYSIDVKTAEPIGGSNFFVATHMTQGKIYGQTKVEKVDPEKNIYFKFTSSDRKIVENLITIKNCHLKSNIQVRKICKKRERNAL